MNTVTAVFFFAVLRALLVGYGGGWFFPVVAGEAVNASLAFLCIAVGHWALRRLARSDKDPAARVLHVATFAVLFAAFGKGWAEPHSALSSVLDMDAKLNPALIAIGVLVGLASERAARSLGHSTAAASVWAITGWLLVGPTLYAEFDHVMADRRLFGASVIATGFAVFGIALAMVGRAVGAVPMRNGLAALAFGVLLFAGLGPSAVGEKALADADSVLLIVVDTLRADMLDTPDGARPHPMPRLSELARRGIRFTNAIAPAPWTLPSTATIVSGMNPYRHRVGATAGHLALPGKPQAFYLAPTLRAAGFQSLALVNNPYLRPYFGFHEGMLLFRRYHGTAHDGTALAMSWLARHDYRPFFAMLHLMDPHWPYEAPAGFGEIRNECSDCDDLSRIQYEGIDEEARTELARRYRSEVSFTDHEIGRLYERLGEHGLLERTWIIVTSDHGEELWDHDRFLHGHSLYDELVRVPLVIVPPRGSDVPSGRTIDQQVRLEDIAPTILEIATGREADAMELQLADGSPADVELDGRSLLEYIEAEEGSEAQWAPRDAILGFVQAQSSLRYGVRTQRHKLIDQGKGKFRLLYDLESDHAETKNLALGSPELMRSLSAIPRSWGLDPIATPSAVGEIAGSDQLDADLAAELKALGYLD